jgi:hypothetical protein
MTDKLAPWDDADSLESLLAVLEREEQGEEQDPPGWSRPFPSSERLQVLTLLTPTASCPPYTHVVNGYFQPVLRVQARPTYLTGTEPMVADLRGYVEDHLADRDYHPLTTEEAYDIEVILSRCAQTQGLVLDRTKPNIPLAGWVYVTFRDAPQPGTWLAERGPCAEGGQWPEFYILAWEPKP